MPKLLAILIAVALGISFTAGSTTAATTVQQPATASQVTPLLVTSTNPPLRVLGSDGLVHLEYDLVLTNVFTAPVTLTAIEVIGPDGSELLRLAGDALAASTAPVIGGAPSAEVPMSGTVATVIDLALAADSLPAQLTHRITYALPADAPALSLLGSRTLNGPALSVDPRPALVLAPPLRGDGWLSANGCCAADSIHRSLRLVVDGSHYAKPETFAIDWIQLQGGRLFTGDGSRNEQWFAFGDDVLAAAAGTVVSVQDGLPEQTPFQTVGVLQPSDYAGNNVVIQLAPAVWATYAHLQPGSVTVQVGDQVTTGQRLGQLGNTGNSTGPHLHFQISDGPDVLTANSLPFVFDGYTLAGVIDPEAPEAAALTQSVEPNPEAGPQPGGESAAASGLPLEGTPQAQAGTHPLIWSVSDFP